VSVEKSPAGANWRIAQTETTECGGCYWCTDLKALDPGAVRRKAAIGIRQLHAGMSLDAWGGKPVAIPPPAGEPIFPLKWYFIPFRSAPGRGLALRIREHPPGPKVLVAPLYFMDRTHGTQRLVETFGFRRDQEDWRMRMIEHDGFLLVSSSGIANTGEQIFHPPGYARLTAGWVKRPRPVRVDAAGLRRLRERFR